MSGDYMKHFKSKLLVLLLLFNISAVNSCVFADKVAKWTIMIYAQADSILNNFAAKNFHAMATIGSNENLNIITQWNQPRKRGTWRYKIEKNKMTLIDSRTLKTRRDFSRDLIDFADFTAKHYPAEKYILILWNHGIGILDPEWSQLHNFAVNPASLRQNPRAQIEGITCETTNTCTTLDDAFYTTTACNNITFSDTYCEDMSITGTRGILFDMIDRNYLTNQGLTNALDHITTKIIKKKFSIIGMDACLEAMLEVFYQIKDFAHYVVSSEEVELAQGWNYKPFLYALTNTEIDERELAKIIVHSFEDFYKGKTRFYTQSAIDLNKIDFLKQNLDQIVSNIILCKKNNPKIMSVVQKARQECFQLSVSCYIDLYSFYAKLKNKLDRIKYINNQEFKNLKSALADGMQLIDNIIITSVASNYLSQAKGISIYYPKKTIDRSYLQTMFVQDSLWLAFLQEVVR